MCSVIQLGGEFVCAVPWQATSLVTSFLQHALLQPKPVVLGRAQATRALALVHEVAMLAMPTSDAADAHTLEPVLAGGALPLLMRHAPQGCQLPALVPGDLPQQLHDLRIEGRCVGLEVDCRAARAAALPGVVADPRLGRRRAGGRRLACYWRCPRRPERCRQGCRVSCRLRAARTRRCGLLGPPPRRRKSEGVLCGEHLVPPHPVSTRGRPPAVGGGPQPLTA
mmetsp:Transcript_8820/g.27455  ORF Transcript_8820/g.27455 Transcript_8820/m.27455 type:complete len:224 (+) Transcript_8820:240-911(+)